MSSSSRNCPILIAKDEPFVKSTPAACSTAFPLKLSAPEGSLRITASDDRDSETRQMTYTILEKLEKGETELAADGRFGASEAMNGRPAPRPAPIAPPVGNTDGSMSLRVKPGLIRLLDIPPRRTRARGKECAACRVGCGGLRCVLANCDVVASVVGEGTREDRFASYKSKQ